MAISELNEDTQDQICDLLEHLQQIDLYFFVKDADLSEWNNAIKDYENERSRCRNFNS